MHLFLETNISFIFKAFLLRYKQGPGSVLFISFKI